MESKQKSLRRNAGAWEFLPSPALAGGVNFVGNEIRKVDVSEAKVNKEVTEEKVNDKADEAKIPVNAKRNFKTPEEVAATEPEETKVNDDSGNEPPEKPDKKSRKVNLPRKKYFVVPGAVLLVLVIIWIIGNLFFMNFKLGGTNLSVNKSDAQLSAAINQKAGAYKLAVNYPNGKTKTYSMTQIGVTPKALESINSARDKQSSFSQRLKWWQPIPFNLIFKVNYEKFNDFIAANITLVNKPAVDAKLTVKNGKVALDNASSGEAYGLKHPDKTILSYAGTLNPKSITLEALNVKPAITSADLANSETTLKKALNQPIHFDIDGQTITPSPSDIAGWLELTPDKQTKTVNFTVNSGEVASYIDSVSKPYVNPPKAQVNVKKGGQITTLIAGINGTAVTNENAVAAAVSKTLMSGQGINEPLTVSHAPYNTITAGDWPKWIEVNLTTHRLYAYQHGTLVNTILVSAGTPETPTPTGQFKIWTKLPVQTMSGPGYVQPNVPWVNYFDHSGDAIHGAYWRPDSVYGNVNASHGCVEMEIPNAIWVYNWAPIGTPVVIHD